MFQALGTREDRVAKAEVKAESANDKLRTLIADRTKQPAITDRMDRRVHSAEAARDDAEARLENAKAWRDFTSAKLRLFLDYALEHTPYTFDSCESCSGQGVPNCGGCGGKGVIRKEKTSHHARASAKVLQHLNTVLDDYELCRKIKARSGDASDAFAALKDRHMGLVRKFSNPTQTAVEADDAQQGAQIGLFDAALRYDPNKPDHYYCSRCELKEPIAKHTKPDGSGKTCNKKFVNDECGNCGYKIERPRICPACIGDGKKVRMMVMGKGASYQTYAWNWCRRDTRARKKSQERPGLQPSIDDPTFSKVDDDGAGMSSQVVQGEQHAEFTVTQSDSSPYGSDIRQDLLVVISEMPEDTRKVMALVLEERSISEIARLLGMTTRAVDRAKKGGFETIRRRLTDSYAGA